MKGLITILFLLYNSLLLSQPEIRWTQIYDGNQSYDVPRNMCKDKNNNFIVAGISVVSDIPMSDYQIVILKYDQYGNQNLTIERNNVGNTNDDVYRVVSDDSMNLYFTGFWGNFRYLAKYDSLGNQIWFKGFPGISDEFNQEDLILDQSDNLYLTYYVYDGDLKFPCIRKYDKDGNLIFFNQFDTLSTIWSEPSYFYYDGNREFYLLGNKAVNLSYYKFFIIKFDSDANVVWYNEYSSEYNINDSGIKLINNASNELIVLATAYVPGNENDIYILKLNSQGEKIWERFINGPANSDDTPYDIITDKNDDIVVNGYICERTTPNVVTQKFFTAKYNIDGDQIFQAIYDEGPKVTGLATILSADSSNKIYSVGRIASQPGSGPNTILIVKYDEMGNMVWNIKKNIYGGENTPVSFILNDRDDFTLTATCGGIVMESNIVTMRFSDEPLQVINEGMNFSFILEQNFPNPFNPSTRIEYSITLTSNVKLQVYDILGNEVITLVDEIKNPGSYEIIFDGSEYPSGIYFYRLQQNNLVITKKMLLLK